MALVLFGTEACHLCELAQTVLMECAASIPCDVFLEDISESEALVDRYGSRIPVLLHEESQRELQWPFTHDDLLEFIRPIVAVSPTDSE
ncbi:glutaredoxin family protein [Thalassolituus sp. LLYu03]|uniref:glutaredoxin family protein n=1 Tax=Thalassolituus sp. LLYu03 TaxID=3421656 RepID=UPI003D2D84E1